MPTRPQPTNRDIVDLVIANHKETSDRLGAVETQVKYTNGRVKALETRAAQYDAVEEYKNKVAQQPVPATAVKVETSTTWDWKTVLAIILTLATAVAALAGVNAV
jgi:hypothetical protein